MDNDQLEGAGGSAGGGKPTAPESADDVGISNTGQRVRAILVALVAVAAAVAALVLYNAKKQELKLYEDARVAFQKAHTMGYSDFWALTQVDIKEMKSNEDFELRMKQILSDDAVRYGKHIKEKCLPVIDQAMPEYQAVTVPDDFADKIDVVVKAMETMRTEWNGFADELIRLESFFEAKKKLDKTANAWLGAQQSKNEKYKKKAFKYFQLLQCVLKDKKVEELETADINRTVQGSCLNDQAEWYRRVAFDCMPNLSGEGKEPNEAYFAAIKKSRGSERMDHASKFGIEDCLKSTRNAVETDMIDKVARAWVGYVRAQNEFLGAVDAKLKEIR